MQQHPLVPAVEEPAVEGQRHHVPVPHRHALGHAGRAGRVHHVGRLSGWTATGGPCVGGARSAQATRPGPSTTTGCATVDPPPGGLLPCGVGEQRPYAGSPPAAAASGRRGARHVQRHVRAARLDDASSATTRSTDRLHQHADRVLRPHAEPGSAGAPSGSPARPARRSSVQPTVRRPAPWRRGVRRPARRTGSATVPAGSSAVGVVPLHEHLVPLGRVKHREFRAAGRSASCGDASQQHRQVLGQPLDVAASNRPGS